MLRPGRNSCVAILCVVILAYNRTGTLNNIQQCHSSVGPVMLLKRYRNSDILCPRQLIYGYLVPESG